jgi:DNA repair photolyase
MSFAFDDLGSDCPPARASSERVDRVEPGLRRGRGATLNQSGRFEPAQRETYDDGWERDEPLAPLKTEVALEKPKTVITRNDSPDLAFDRSINPYRGCEHGCVYCFARPTHAYMGLSPGLDFETKLFAKQGAAALLERELAHPHYKPQTIAIGTNTDPYQPIERTRRVMRSILEVLHRTSHPVAIVTKSNLVLRDMDLLAPMAAEGLAKIAISITTLDPVLARTMEPRAPSPAKRLEAIRQLHRAGIPVAVMVAPIVPGLTDHEIEKILAAAWEAGAREAGYVLLRLPLEVKDLMRSWLEDNAPDKAKHVMSLVRSTRGGKDYDASFSQRQTGTGPYAWTLGRRFEMAARRLGFNERKITMRTDLFDPPIVQGGQYPLL